MPSSRPSPDRQHPRILHGRRRGRPLRKRQLDLLRTLLPNIEIRAPEADGTTLPVALNLDLLFPDSGQTRRLWLEIGFGGGEHLLFQARAHPEIGFIGCEPFVNGVVKLLSGIDHGRRTGDAISNIRIFRRDGQQLLEHLPRQCLDRASLLFPDPWPKTRHHKRRFIQQDTVDQFARVLKANAELRIATDHAELCRWVLRHLASHPSFEWMAEDPDDWRRQPLDWAETRYETKAAKACRQRYFLSFKRNSAPAPLASTKT
ncbi:MAG TPA: tRNA (guanosine(46)-N7)-methyltransferase TrmB [Sneathiellales bacterium]|nr:tRNA (guanosine(46)-N7)-methyltransferase TrmB [Sneathiellales bacterium]